MMRVKGRQRERETGTGGKTEAERETETNTNTITGILEILSILFPSPLPSLLSQI